MFGIKMLSGVNGDDKTKYKHHHMKELTKESLVKHVVILIILIFIYRPVKESLTPLVMGEDGLNVEFFNEVVGTMKFLTLASLIAIFGTMRQRIYDTTGFRSQMLAHLTTTFLLLLLGTTLEVIGVMTGIKLGHVPIVYISLTLLYIGFAGMDLWFAVKTKESKKKT